MKLNLRDQLPGKVVDIKKDGKLITSSFTNTRLPSTSSGFRWGNGRKKASDVLVGK